MSSQKVIGTPEGYERQIFPTGLDKLNRTYDALGANGQKLMELGETIDGYEASMFMPVTKDNIAWFYGRYLGTITSGKYGWLWELRFKTENGGIAVLFPQSQDWDKHDGIRLDRSVAVYTKGNVGMQEVEGLIYKLYDGLFEREIEKFGKELKRLLEEGQL